MKSKLNYLDVACTFPEQHDVHDGQNGEFIRLFKVERNHPRCRTGWKLDTYKIFSKIIDIEIIFVFFFVFLFLFFFFVFFLFFFLYLLFIIFLFFSPSPSPSPSGALLFRSTWENKWWCSREMGRPWLAVLRQTWYQNYQSYHLSCSQAFHSTYVGERPFNQIHLINEGFV